METFPIASTTSLAKDASMVDEPTSEPARALTAIEPLVTRDSLLSAPPPALQHSQAQCEADPATRTTPPAEDSPNAGEAVNGMPSTPSKAETSCTAVIPALLTPSPSASSPDRIPTSANGEWTEKSRADNHKRARPYSRTRQMIRHRTDKMVVTASRGFGRAGYPPTKVTKPAMHARRYSVDVVTSGWESKYWAYWKPSNLKVRTLTSHDSSKMLLRGKHETCCRIWCRGSLRPSTSPMRSGACDTAQLSSVWSQSYIASC